MKKNRNVICDSEFDDFCLGPFPYEMLRATVYDIDGKNPINRIPTLSYGKYYEARTMIRGLIKDEQDEEIILLYNKLIDSITNLDESLKKRRKIKALSKQREETEKTAEIVVAFVIGYLIANKEHGRTTKTKEWLEIWIPAVDGLTEDMMALLPR